MGSSKSQCYQNKYVYTIFSGYNIGLIKAQMYYLQINKKINENRGIAVINYFL